LRIGWDPEKNWSQFVTSSGPSGRTNAIYDAIENLLDEKAAQRHWEDRERIGFKKREGKTGN
jgi:hypothetical protein